MGFWIFMVVMSLLIPVIMMIFGKFSSSRAPKEINYIFGYRTTMSMKNMDTWKFAHQYCGKIWWTCGRIIFVVSIVLMLLIIGKDENTVGILGVILVLIQTVCLIVSIFPTEKALRKTFDENGNRKL